MRRTASQLRSALRHLLCRPLRGGSTIAATLRPAPRSRQRRGTTSSALPQMNSAPSMPFFCALRRASSTAGAQISTPFTSQRSRSRCARLSPMLPVPLHTSSTSGAVPSAAAPRPSSAKPKAAS